MPYFKAFLRLLLQEFDKAKFVAIHNYLALPLRCGLAHKTHLRSFLLKMTTHLVILSVAKNPHFKGAICILNLWILRFLTKAQYDK